MLALKTLHVAAAVLWLGNFAVTGVWALRAASSRDAQLATFAAREILFTDAVFTLIFGAAVTISGLVMARDEHLPVFALLWTRAALEIVLASAVVWLAVLLPIELRMYARSRSGRTTGRLFAAWNVVGWSLTAALFAVIYFMIAKPV